MEPLKDVKGNLAEELYGESLQISKPGLDSSSHGVDDYSFEDNDGSVWGSDEESSRASLDREWQRRREEFHAIGYRDGIIAGKEAAAQEGFNIGFKQSVLAGYKFGLVRGVSSAVAFLPDDLRGKLTGREQETEGRFRRLHNSVRALSTEDAAKLFYGALTTKQANEKGDEEEEEEEGSDTAITDPFQSYAAELSSLLNKSPKIELRLAPERQLLP